MLIGIIKEKTNKTDYYIYLKDEIINVIAAHKKNIRYLNSDEIKELFSYIFSPKLVLKEKTNEYDIYLDEANNKRYYKNGIEDFIMFFNNNGVNAINYIGDIEEKKIQSKRFKIKAALIALEIIIVSPFAFLALKSCSCDIGDVLLSYQEIKVDDLESLIMNSELSDEEKELLYNENFLNFVLEAAGNNRNYSIQHRLENLNVSLFNPEDSGYHTDGLYNPLDLNTIYINENISRNTVAYRDTLTHEFIHLMQDQNNYYYIREACAELMSTEFYGSYPDSYRDLIIRVKVLMEIIGPQPIIECNFSGDTTSFEEAIGAYLDENDKERLLELFQTSSETILDMEDEEFNNMNSEIDSILATMYYNKTGDYINSNPMINLIYMNSANDRVYFNSELPEYNRDFQLGISSRRNIDVLDINDIINSDTVKNYVWFRHEEVEIDGTIANTYNPIEINDFSSIEISENEWVEIIFNDGTIGHATYDFENNTWNPVTHYQIIINYEPSIPNKFPDQVSNKTHEIEILTMLDDKDVQNEEVKII